MGHNYRRKTLSNIDSMTVGALGGILAMLLPLLLAWRLLLPPMLGSSQSETRPHPFVGQYVICRCESAGVHAGILVSQTGDHAVLLDSRRLWSWRANSGVALSGVAQHGIDRTKSKVDSLNPSISLTGVIETIPCSPVSQESIHGA